jgi:hypothetical protein
MHDADGFKSLGTGRTPSQLRLWWAITLAICVFNVSASAFPWSGVVPPLTGPYATAGAGDWVSFKSTTADTTTKRTIVRRTAFSITIRYEGDLKSPPVDRTIEFTGPKPKDGGTVEVLDTGKESLTMGGKNYESEWTKTKITYPGQASLTAPRAPIVILRKKWLCKDVPLDGEIKCEVEMDGHTIGWKMTGFGRGK